MIGVLADPREHTSVCEFFELFKTPWEFFREDAPYDVVLSTGARPPNGRAPKLLVVFGSRSCEFDVQHQIEIQPGRERATVSHGGASFPIFGKTSTFRREGPDFRDVLIDPVTQRPVGYARIAPGPMWARIGYDLFQEVEMLLGQGQPAEHSGTPTLELHIELLRELLRSSGIAFVEIPPVPEGYAFIGCLTHDVDHASLRRHRFDHTFWGFLYRAVVGSVFNAFRGRLPVRNLLQNWAAAAKLPLIQIGLAQDIWRGFDRYVDIEKGRPSTFFVIPFEGTPGINQKGPAPRKRAARYDVSHVTPQIARLTSAGCEIGLHGIDAWIDSVRGQEEAKRISAFSGNADIGVRMHWLYRSAESPAHLEKAGFSYDSTVGYNETVGFRAGTGQAFKPLNATRLLELPMQAMDTALFFSHYLDLSPDDAWRRLEALLDIATSRGGAVTVNWHDRSISPERLWGDLYSRLIAGMTVKGAWFGSASQTIAWFRQRRAITFHRAGNRIEARVPGESRPDIPPCRLRVYPGSSSGASIAATAAKDRNGYVDMPLRENHTI